MWPAENGVYVVVGARHVECARVVAGRWAPAVSVEIDGALTGGCIDALALDEAKPRSTGTVDMRVLVSDRWLNGGEVLWSQALTQGQRQAEMHARRRLADAGCSVDDTALLRLDDAGFGKPRFVQAYPAELLAALNGLARRSGARLRSVLPIGAAAWLAHAKGDAVAVVDSDVALIAAGAEQRLQQVVVRHGGASWEALWARMQLREPRWAAHPRPPVIDLRGRNGAEASAALSLARTQRKARLPLDAVVQRPRGRLAWPVAAGIAFVALAVTLQALQARAQLRAAEASLQALQQQGAPAPQAVAWTREELVRAQSANAAIRELNLPIAALLAALNPPRDLRVAVLSAEVSGSATVRITAETRTAAEMTQYAAFVGSRAPFAEAYVTRHEIDVSSPEKPYRFALEASWNN